MEIKKYPDYLRLSITDRCNLNCIYCTPLKKEEFFNHTEVLSHEEIIKLVNMFVKIGIRKVRLTGGEPLLKNSIIKLVEMLKQIKDLEEISMTTNGVELKNYAYSLKNAGLDRINISLDTLQREKFKTITGKDSFDEVWEGIDYVMKLGFNSVKLNVVPMQNINQNEIADFVRLIFDYPLIVRFIEFFHTNQRSQQLINLLIPTEEIKKNIEKEIGQLKLISKVVGHGPAYYYTLDKAKGAIGFISGSTSNFCYCCNRIRLDCAGRISPCLFSGPVYDSRPLLRKGDRDDELFEDIKKVICKKKDFSKETIKERRIEMSSLGG